MYLIDSSIWIAYFRKKSKLDLRSIVKPSEIYTCLPVYQEVLQGIRDEKHFHEVKNIMNSFQFVESPLSMEVFLSAVEIYRLGRKMGITLRSSIDSLIASCALKYRLTVLHSDRDYSNISKFTGLSERNIKV